MKSLKQQLPDAVVLDLVQCGDEIEGCTNICGSDTICHCNSESENWGDVHIQNQEGFNGPGNNTTFCNDCAETNLCSRCCTSFCNANENSLECVECNKLLCQTCNMEDQERIQNGEKLRKDKWGCDDEHGQCDCDDEYNEFHDVSTHFHNSICSSCAIKCKNCDAMLCAESSVSSYNYYNESNEPACNELNTCQYCAQEFCNNCRVKDDDSYENSAGNLKILGRCDHPDPDWCPCCSVREDCASFTCSSCMDQMIECDGCGETRCGVCFQKDAMKKCDGCEQNLCCGKSQYDYEEDKETCRLEECCTCKKSFCDSCRTEQNWNERREEDYGDLWWESFGNICCEDCVEK